MRNKNLFSEKRNDFWIVLLAGAFFLVMVGGLLYYYGEPIKQWAVGNNEAGDVLLTKPTQSGRVTGQLPLQNAARFLPYRDSFVLWTDGGIKAVNREGKASWNLDIPLTNPLVQTADKYLMVADRGGKELTVMSGKNKKYSVQAENPIYHAKLGINGATALLAEEHGYKGKVTVYNTDGQKVYQWFSGEHYVVDMALSPNGDDLYVVTSNTTKGTVSSGILFFHLNEKKPYYETVIDDAMPITLKGYGSGRVVLITDMGVYGFTDTKQSWHKNFEGQALKTFSTRSNEYIALVLRQKKGGNMGEAYSLLWVLDSKGSKRGETSVAGEVESIDMAGNTVLLKQQRFFYFVNTKGKQVSKGILWNKDVQGLKLLDNEREVMAGGAGEITWISCQ